MHRLSHVFVIGLVLIAPAVGVLTLPAAAVGAGQGNVTMTVSVVTDTGDPVSGAELTASWDGGSATESTASNGKAFVDVPEGADVTIRISHPEYVRNHPYTVSGATESEETVTVYAKASATITVVDASGSPVADARVDFKKDGRSAVKKTTDAQGVVESGVLEAGQYTVTVSKTGYYRTDHDLRIVADTTSEVAIERGLVTVEFQVLDDHFDPPEPIEGATISGDEVGSIKSQTNGIQRVSVPANSQLSVAVEKEGYEPIEETILVGESDKQVDLTTSRTPALEIEILADRVVAGTQTRLSVTDEYGDPATQSTVYLDGSAVGTPDDEGVILVPIEEPGEHTIHAERGSVSSASRSVEAIEPRTPLPDTTMTATAGTTEAPDDSPASTGAGFVAAGTITDQGIHLVSAGLGIAVGFVLALLLVLYMRLGGSSE